MPNFQAKVFQIFMQIRRVGKHEEKNCQHKIVSQKVTQFKKRPVCRGKAFRCPQIYLPPFRKVLSQKYIFNNLLAIVSTNWEMRHCCFAKEGSEDFQLFAELCLREIHWKTKNMVTF